MKAGLMIKNGVKQFLHGFQRPFMMMFETTLHCNMACEYFTVWSNDRNEKVMTKEQAFRRIDEAIDLGIFALSFSGGKPLLNPNTADYIVYGADRGLPSYAPDASACSRPNSSGSVTTPNVWKVSWSASLVTRTGLND